MIYDAEGNQLYACYDAEGNALNHAYDAEGAMIFSIGSIPWDEEITTEKLYNASAQTYYYVVTIPQTRTDGSKQYPFVFVPNGSNGGTMSTLTMVQTYGFPFGMNGGYFDYSETHTYKPRIIAIQNSESIECQYYEWNATNNYILTIDGEGNLGYADPMSKGTTAEGLLNDGVVSAIAGLVPLVVNGVASQVESSVWASSERAQRQIIGQKANSDYVVITCEGRNFDSSNGFTVSEARTLCLNMGLKFAMAVDGGGSTETVIGDTQLNTIYEGTTGRIVPTYIVFNGTDKFVVPTGLN
jgi:exopolysaccharide biosynthesis protein